MKQVECVYRCGVIAALPADEEELSRHEREDHVQCPGCGRKPNDDGIVNYGVSHKANCRRLRKPWEPSYGGCAEYVTDRVGLAHALEAVRRRVCAYMGESCDCKYGLTTEKQERQSSERTGCPELRELTHRLLHRPESFGVAS